MPLHVPQQAIDGVIETISWAPIVEDANWGGLPYQSVPTSGLSGLVTLLCAVVTMCLLSAAWWIPYQLPYLELV